jgi:hypothetical protein
MIAKRRLALFAGLAALWTAVPTQAQFLIDPTDGYDLVANQEFPGDLDDDVTDPRPLGFTFNFFGAPQTQLRISSNGHVNFIPLDGATADSWRNYRPSHLYTAPRIAVIWDDLTFGLGDLPGQQDPGQIFEKRVAGRYYSISFVNAHSYRNNARRSDQNARGTRQPVAPEFRQSGQVVLFEGDTRIKGFEFKAGDIVMSYGRIQNRVTGGLTNNPSGEQTFTKTNSNSVNGREPSDSLTVGLFKGDGTLAFETDISNPGTVVPIPGDDSKLYPAFPNATPPATGDLPGLLTFGYVFDGSVNYASEEDGAFTRVLDLDQRGLIPGAFADQGRALLYRPNGGSYDASLILLEGGVDGGLPGYYLATRGVEQGFNLVNKLNNDDDVYAVVQQRFQFAPTLPNAELVGTLMTPSGAPLTGATLVVRVKANSLPFSDPSCRQEIALRNWNTGRFEVVDSRKPENPGSGEPSISVNLDATQRANFVRGDGRTDVAVRVFHLAPLFTAWSMSVDQIVLNVQR